MTGAGRSRKGPPMSVTLLTNAVFGLAVIAFLVSRQLRWSAFEPAKALKLPLILAVVGFWLLRSEVSTISTVDITFLLIELAISLAVGAGMGRLTSFRTDPARPHELQARTGGAGVALWVVLIALRVGLDLLGSALGAQVVTATGVILILLAATRASSALVARTRAPQLTPARA